MATRARGFKAALTRRAFLGVCGSASALFPPAPLFGAGAFPLFQTAAPQTAAANRSFQDYQILPHYRTRSPLEELIRKAREKRISLFQNTLRVVLPVYEPRSSARCAQRRATRLQVVFP